MPFACSKLNVWILRRFKEERSAASPPLGDRVILRDNRALFVLYWIDRPHELQRPGSKKDQAEPDGTGQGSESGPSGRRASSRVAIRSSPAKADRFSPTRASNRARA